MREDLALARHVSIQVRIAVRSGGIFVVVAAAAAAAGRENANARRDGVLGRWQRHR